MPVRELLARTDSRELTEWVAYEQLTGPLGFRRADVHAGIIAATIHNVNVGKKGRKAKPDDYIPQWGRRSQSWEEQLRAIRAINRQMGGTETAR